VTGVQTCALPISCITDTTPLTTSASTEIAGSRRIAQPSTPARLNNRQPSNGPPINIVRKKPIGVQMLYQVGTVSMLLYTRTLIQTKTTPRTIVTLSHSVRNAGDSFFSIASNQPMPPTAKKIEPLAISLLSAEAPTRLSELKARI